MNLRAAVLVVPAVIVLGCGGTGATATPVVGGPTAPTGGGLASPAAGSGNPASACTANGPVAAGNYSGTVTYKVHFVTTLGSVSSTNDVTGSGPISFKVDASGGVTGTWSLTETGSSTSTSPVGNMQTKLSGSLTNGEVGGTTSALTLGGAVQLSQQIIVNGVGGPVATSSVPFSGGTGYALQATCSGGATAELQIPSAGADIRIDTTRTGS